MHQIIYALQLAQPDCFERRLDNTPAVELESFGRVLAVAHVAALDGHHFDDGLEYRGAQVGAGGEADADCTRTRRGLAGRSYVVRDKGREVKQEGKQARV